MQKPEKWQSLDEQACNKQSNLMAAHNKAFQEVCQVVEKDILDEKKIKIGRSETSLHIIFGEN